MKKVIIAFVLTLCTFSAFAQEHIQFNGATFGVNKETFLSNINKSFDNNHTLYVRHTYKDIYNRYFSDLGKVNTYNACYYIHSSLKTDMVFEVIAWFHVSNLKEEFMLYVKGLETKYGGHIEEDAENLGTITTRKYDHDKSGEYREMMALKYIIRSKTTNKPIGEVRISAAPQHSPTYDGDSGYIELTYRDFAAADAAMNEYERTLNSIL